ncbi:hypothetical protein CcrColossus_gp227 [Caulobacter phage CcrColossus]|uniref:Uncharacterized protein n=1 Tax=Caulobacter phage CcrColossus TaxID=1211640 RepID=K4K6D1_9CAUD|nr:hypothetical protein CcrColossus_gp227 [Caulobacter phage CcrColossus]AFU88097.1 hypothetical protein CcrColossus_gp227 [Caulobacter phage CcrColossus]
MNQRANFYCPIGGQPLVAIHNDVLNALTIRTLQHEHSTEDTQLWLASIGWGLERNISLKGAKTLLAMGGVRDIEFEGI